MTEAQDFPGTLRRLIDAQGLSQSDVARKVWNKTRKTKNGYVLVVGKDRISAWLKGKSLPNRKSQEALAAALGVTVDELFPAKQTVALQGGGKLTITIEWKP